MSANNLLYHFTKTESFFDILKNLTLKPSLVGGLNDLNEANIQSCYSLPIMTLVKAREMLQRCSVLCFSKDYDDDLWGHSGANRPNMWAYYAGATDGVCLVIDEEKFRTTNKHLLDKFSLGFKDVEYKYIHSKTIDGHRETDAKEFIRSNVDQLFFTKHISWQQEAERRVALMGLDPEMEMFSIDGCVSRIVLGRRFLQDKENVQKLISYLINPGYACYHKFIPHNFAMATYNTSGYWITECAFEIMEPLYLQQRELTEPEKQYYQWLHEEMGY